MCVYIYIYICTPYYIFLPLAARTPKLISLISYHPYRLESAALPSRLAASRNL